ncbi:MAG: hypothetical protein U0Q21_00535 [Dermatophilaceae bacterium]
MSRGGCARRIPGPLGPAGADGATGPAGPAGTANGYYDRAHVAITTDYAAPVVSIDVPPGSYFASMTVRKKTTVPITCFVMKGETGSGSDGSGGTFTEGTLAWEIAGTFTLTGTFSVECESPSGAVEDVVATLSIVQVTNLSLGPGAFRTSGEKLTRHVG